MVWQQWSVKRWCHELISFKWLQNGWAWLAGWQHPSVSPLQVGLLNEGIGEVGSTCRFLLPRWLYPVQHKNMFHQVGSSLFSVTASEQYPVHSIHANSVFPLVAQHIWSVNLISDGRNWNLLFKTSPVSTFRRLVMLLDIVLWFVVDDFSVIFVLLKVLQFLCKYYICYIACNKTKKKLAYDKGNMGRMTRCR